MSTGPLTATSFIIHVQQDLSERSSLFLTGTTKTPEPPQGRHRRKNLPTGNRDVRGTGVAVGTVETVEELGRKGRGPTGTPQGEVAGGGHALGGVPRDGGKTRVVGVREVLETSVPGVGATTTHPTPLPLPVDPVTPSRVGRRECDCDS